MNNMRPVMAYLSRYIGLIVLGLLTVIGIYVIWSYIFPKYQEIQGVRAEIEILTAKREDLTTYVAYLHELETTTLPLEEELVSYALPSENDVISLIVTYEGLSKTPDVEVSPFDLSPGLIKTTEENGEGTIVRGNIPTPEASGSTGTESQELEFDMEARTEKPETAIDFINKIHQTRRVFSIKSLTWQNPADDANVEDGDKIVLTMSLGTYYYSSSPKVTGSAELVNKGKTQGDFISKLTNTTIFDALILDSVEVGKEDLFTLGDSNVTPTPRPNPLPVQEATPTNTVIQPPVTF